MTDVELVVLEDAEAAVQRAAREVAEAAARGGHVALSGGSTRPVYKAAAKLQSDWRRVTLWFADDRCVPPEDPRSNYRLVGESLLDGLATLPQVQRVRCERPVEEAASLYDEELAGVTLDFVLLGIGPDGHTASLFPNAPALDEQERRAVAAEAGLEPFVPRVTMTLPVLRGARLAVFLVTGEAKAEAVSRAFGGGATPATPASLVRAARTLAVLDRAAAAGLDAASIAEAAS